jgi:enoyl-CoA hydratase
MVSSTVIHSIENDICTIKLNRPERMNAVNEELYEELLSVLAGVKENINVRVVVITGSSMIKDGVEKKAFCAGADLKKHSAGERTSEEKRNYIELAHRATRAVYEFPKPVIAAVNGPARGAGAELAMCCDFILMSDNATIGFPETGLGTFVGGGVTMLLQRTAGVMRAKELVYSGRILNGPEAVKAGIALASYPEDEFFAEVSRFVMLLAEKAPVSMALAKKNIQAAALQDIGEVLNRETEAVLLCMETEDWREGVAAFSEKRKPLYKGK